jgi:hypothetical protein
MNGDLPISTIEWTALRPNGIGQFALVAEVTTSNDETHELVVPSWPWMDTVLKSLERMPQAQAQLNHDLSVTFKEWSSGAERDRQERERADINNAQRLRDEFEAQQADERALRKREVGNERS